MTLKDKFLCAALVTLATISAPAAVAQQGDTSDPTKDPLMITAGFLSGHPDLRYRLLGLEVFKLGRHDDALRFFKRAGFYADKPSQGMVAEMYWTGQGTPRDPVAAYIWMDLAAERGYEGFVLLRERYWRELDETQRAQAIEVGQGVYARYGDAAAQPRIDAVIRRYRNRVTGSRTGATGNLQIIIPGPNGMTQIDGSKFYDKQFWDPELYRGWHDRIWRKMRVGKVSVGELESLQGAAQQPARSRIPETAPIHDAHEPEVPHHESDVRSADPMD